MTNSKEYKVNKIVKKNKKYLVYLENLEEELVITEDQIVEFRIITGTILDQETLNKLKKSINDSTLYNKALHYIDYKPRTKKEIEKYLKDAEASDESISSIVKRLIKVHYIDDERYAQSFVLESIRKEKGRNYINNTLLEKGIDPNYILDCLEEYDKEMEIENATKKANKVTKTISKYPIKKQKQKITERLITDGFGYDVINTVLAKIELIDESSVLLEKEYNRLLLKQLDNSKIIQKLLMKGFDYSDIKKILK